MASVRTASSPPEPQNAWPSKRAKPRHLEQEKPTSNDDDDDDDDDGLWVLGL